MSTLLVEAVATHRLVGAAKPPKVNQKTIILEASASYRLVRRPRVPVERATCGMDSSHPSCTSPEQFPSIRSHAFTVCRSGYRIAVGIRLLQAHLHQAGQRAGVGLPRS